MATSVNVTVCVRTLTAPVQRSSPGQREGWEPLFPHRRQPAPNKRVRGFASPASSPCMTPPARKVREGMRPGRRELLRRRRRAPRNQARSLQLRRQTRLRNLRVLDPRRKVRPRFGTGSDPTWQPGSSSGSASDWSTPSALSIERSGASRTTSTSALAPSSSPSSPNWNALTERGPATPARVRDPDLGRLLAARGGHFARDLDELDIEAPPRAA